MSKPKEILELEEQLCFFQGRPFNIKDFREFDFRNPYFEMDSNNNIIYLNITSLNNPYLHVVNLNSFKYLQRLDMQHNRIERINGLDNLIYLKEINLNSNCLKTIDCLLGLNNLETLRISSNDIWDINGIENLRKLKILDLSRNHIKEIDGIENLSSLQVLDLSHNNLTSIDKLRRIARHNHFKELSIYNNPELSNTVVGYDSIYKNDNNLNLALKYFSDLKQEKVLRILPVKLILIGNHGVGKTTFLQYFQKSNFLLSHDNEITSTHVLHIEPYPKNEDSNNIMAIVYDFGGQDYYHGVYQAFLSEDSIILLFWCQKYEKNDLKKTQDGTMGFVRDYDKNYWLNQLSYTYNIKKRSVIDVTPKIEDPIIIIETHIDKPHKGKIDEDEYLSTNSQNTFHISLDAKAIYENESFHENFEKLKQTIIQEIVKKRQQTEELKYSEEFKEFLLRKINEDYQFVYVSELFHQYKTIRKNNIKDNLLDLGIDMNDESMSRLAMKIEIEHKNDFEMDELPNFVAETINGIKNESDEDLLTYLKIDLDIFYRKGLILYYKDNEQINDVVWLNPSDTIDYIHNEVLSKDFIIENKGIIPESTFHKLSKGEKNVQFEKLIELLISEKVIFYSEIYKYYVVPGYLQLSFEDEDYDRKNEEFSSMENPNFTLKFKYFIPFGLINQLICKYGRFPKDKNWCWRDQINFNYDAYSIRIRLDLSQLTISVDLYQRAKSVPNITIEEIQKQIFEEIIVLYWGGNDIKKYPDDLYISIDGNLFIKPNDLVNTEKGIISAYTLVNTEKEISNKEKIKIISENASEYVWAIDFEFLFFSTLSNYKYFLKGSYEDKTKPLIKKKHLPFIHFSDEIYSDVLHTISIHGRFFEKHPEIYKALSKEENLRDLLLSYLIDRYEKITATAETYNNHGRSDIILKDDMDNNIFIAECKWWSGISNFHKAINQLFNKYITWRDTNVALIFFVKNSSFSSVLNHIIPEASAHPYFIEYVSTKSETNFSFIFRNNNDINKRIKLEIMFFHFPDID